MLLFLRMMGYESTPLDVKIFLNDLWADYACLVNTDISKYSVLAWLLYDCKRGLTITLLIALVWAAYAPLFVCFSNSKGRKMGRDGLAPFSSTVGHGCPEVQRGKGFFHFCRIA